MSESYFYNLKRCNECSFFKWEGVLNRGLRKHGKYGNCGMSWIADVCYHTRQNEYLQRYVYQLIKSHGAGYARQFWALMQLVGGTPEEIRSLLGEHRRR
jgi:hypothetical protein